MTTLQFALAIWAVCIWVLVCNARTANDRRRLLNLVFRGENWRTLLVHFDAISYERHLWQRVTLRDPSRLYPTEWKEEQ